MPLPARPHMPTDELSKRERQLAQRDRELADAEKQLKAVQPQLRRYKHWLSGAAPDEKARPGDVLRCAAHVALACSTTWTLLLYSCSCLITAMRFVSMRACLPACTELSS